jgi:hypothetical protein
MALNRHVEWAYAKRGGGWCAGMYEYSFLSITGAIGDGYITLTTDERHSNGDLRGWSF